MLERWKHTWAGATGERPINHCNLGFCQPQVSGTRVFDDVFSVGSLGNCEERGPTHQKTERDLAWGGTVRISNFLKHTATLGLRTGKVSMAERAVTCNGN